MCLRLVITTAEILVVLLMLRAAAAELGDDDDDAAGERDQAPEAKSVIGRNGIVSGSQVERRCARPTAPRQGRVRMRERGKIAYFRCRRRFLLYGSPRAVCINQTWSHPPPACVAAGCSPISRMRGMTILYPSPTFRNKVLMFFCQPGFRLIGRPTLFCDGRQWSGLAPICVEQLQTTSSVLFESSTVTNGELDSLTSTSEELTVKQPSFLTAVPYSMVSSTDVRWTSVLTSQYFDMTLVPVTSSTLRIQQSSSRTSPLSFSQSLMSSVARESPLRDSEHVHSTSAVTYHDTAVTDAATTKPLPLYLSSRAIPSTRQVSLPDDRGETFSEARDSISSIAIASASSRSPRVQSVVTTYRPADASSSLSHLTSQAQSSDLALDDDTTDLALTNNTADVMLLASSDERHASWLLWYAVGAAACAALLVVVAATTCAVVFRKRTPTFRQYELMSGDDDEVSAAAVTSGRSSFFATQYTELRSTCLDDDDLQPSPSNTTHSSLNNGCSFV